MTVADAFTALSKVVFGRSDVATKEIMELMYSITAPQPGPVTYDRMRWWRDGVEIEMKFRSFGYERKEDDVPFLILMAALEYGPDILKEGQNYSITYC